MPRKLRVEFPGALYFVASRARARKRVFPTDADRQDFLDLLGDACRKTGWLVHAYALLEEGFMLVLETPKPNLALGMRWFMSAYSIRSNYRHRRSGPVFSGRYKSIPIETRRKEYLQMAAGYTHLQRAMAREWTPDQPLTGDPWTSLGPLLGPQRERPAWLRVARVFAAHGLVDTISGRRAFEKIMEGRRGLRPNAPEWRMMRRGWVLGTPAFREQLLDRMPAQLRSLRGGRFRARSDQSKAEHIIREELTQLGWNEKELKKTLKLAPEKLAIAARVRRETTLPIRWIASRLRLGTHRSANTRLHQWMKTGKGVT